MVKDIRETLTLGRIRGMYYSKDIFSKLSDKDLRGLHDWLDLLSVEVHQMKRIAMREISTRLEQAQ